MDIGPRLHAIRKRQKLSLDEVSALTSVSKAMLGQIERGKSIPTVNTLWKIATGLKVPFSAFLSEPAPSYTLFDWKTSSPVLAEEEKMRVYPVFAFDPVTGQETFVVELDEGCIHESGAHRPMVTEGIVVLSGSLEMRLGNEVVPVACGQALRFSASITHTYRNAGTGPCIFYNEIEYKEEPYV